MAIDQAWVTELRAMKDLDTRDTLKINDVEIVLPKKSARGKELIRDWQRRLLPDIIPDSVNADAPERTPFRLLYALTSSTSTKENIEEALKDDLAPLASVFRADTQKKKMTLAFHVLAVKAAMKGEHDVKGYTERTLLLLCRRPDGSLNERLVSDLVEQFRRNPSDLDLAQRVLVERLFPGWTSTQEPMFTLPDSARTPVVPFDPVAASLFQTDVRTLIDAKLPPADFFHQLNLLFTLHLGLYQARVATYLNPQMDQLYKEMAQPDPRNLSDLNVMLAEFARRHPFTESLSCRAPDPDLRKLTRHSPERECFERLATELSNFHFHVLVLGQLRRLAEAYLAHRWSRYPDWRKGDLDPETAAEMAATVRGPRELLARMQDDPDFAPFLRRAVTALAVRFTYNQLPESSRPAAFKKFERAPSGLHVLRALYEQYNIESSANPTASRAYRQGGQITSSLLQRGEYGLMKTRSGVGVYFEMGAGILPLLLLLVVGAGREKIPVEEFWKRLAAYGLAFDKTEREAVLGRLRAMGVYERYSDAGEAAYVRNLMTSTEAA
ncbi:MAG: DNA phosphorothioation-dependent restriction protein DptG [Kofleriaceae bacterium]